MFKKLKVITRIKEVILFDTQIYSTNLTMEDVVWLVKRVFFISTNTYIVIFKRIQFEQNTRVVCNRLRTTQINQKTDIYIRLIAKINFYIICCIQ